MRAKNNCGLRGSFLGVSGQGVRPGTGEVVETKCGWRKKLVWGSELSSGVQGEEEDGLAFCLRHNKDASGPGPHAPAIETSRGLGWRVWVFGVVLIVLPLGNPLVTSEDLLGDFPTANGLR